MLTFRRCQILLVSLCLGLGSLSAPTAHAQAAPRGENVAQLNASLLGVPQSWTAPQNLRFSRLRFEEPKPSRHTLSNGLVVYLLEDHSLPLIDGAAFIKTGSLYDPQAKASLAALTADLMRSGGIKGMSGAALDKHLEAKAASIELRADQLFTSANFSSLKADNEDVLALLAKILRSPQFAPERISFAKGRALEAIRRENDDPVGIAVRELFKRLAAGHPAGYVPTAKTVAAVKRADMLAFYGRYVKPNTTVLAVSGDFDSKVMLERLERIFGSWRAAKVNYPKLPRYNPNPKPLIYHVQKDLGQSVILMARPTVYAYTPAYNALDLANAVLGGGGFNSRIMNEVRSKRGLAYSAGSQLEQGFSYPGALLLYAFTRTEKTAEVIGLLKQELTRMQQTPVPIAELNLQRSNILNGAVFRFTSAAQVVQRVARAREMLGLPADYYQRYLKDLQTLTPKGVQQAAKRYFSPAQMLTMVIGDRAQFDAPLKEFGPVREIGLELPQ